MIVRPGANLEELASVIGRCHLHAGVKMVVIAVGINNHQSPTSSITDSLNVISDAVDRRRLPGTVLFLQVPIHPRMTNASGVKINHLNKTARDLFASRYIRLPADFQFRPANDSRYDCVHYNEETANKVIAHLSEVVRPHLN